MCNSFRPEQNTSERRAIIVSGSRPMTAGRRMQSFRFRGAEALWQISGRLRWRATAVRQNFVDGSFADEAGAHPFEAAMEGSGPAEGIFEPIAVLDRRV